MQVLEWREKNFLSVPQRNGWYTPRGQFSGIQICRLQLTATTHSQLELDSYITKKKFLWKEKHQNGTVILSWERVSIRRGVMCLPFLYFSNCLM